MRQKERQFIEKLKRKDYEEFELFYYQYIHLIHHVVSIYAKDDFTQDDLTQEIFMRIIQKIELFDANKSSLTTWIYTLSKNYVLNYIKSKQSENIILDDMLVSIQEEWPQTNYKSMKQDLKDVLSYLEYEVLFLKVEFRMKHEDIARVLEVSIDQSKKAYQRAKRKAKDILK